MAGVVRSVFTGQMPSAARTSAARTSTFAEQLASMGAARVAALLALRPDVVWTPLPRDLRELVERLEDPHSVAPVLRAAPLPAIQAAEAIQALGGSTSVHELAGFLEGGEDAQVDDVVAWLAERAVVRVADDVIEASAGLAGCFPSPLGLGRPLVAALAPATADTQRRILRLHGQPVPGSKAHMLEALTSYLGDPGTVRAIVSGAREEVAAWLLSRTDDRERDPYEPYVRFDPAAYALTKEAVAWAMARGLLVSSDWGSSTQMPAEVARALRGPAYRAPFTPDAPVTATHDVAPQDVERECAAAASTFSANVAAVLDQVSRAGIPVLKSGGVGAREISRLAKATQSGEVEVRLVLELADAFGLLQHAPQRVVVSDDFPAWRGREPGERYGDLVDSWWRLGAVPTEAREDGKTIAALRRRADCEGCLAARHAVLAALSALPPGQATDVAAIGPVARWSRPLVHAQVEQDDVPFASTWREAELLGLVSRGALTRLGRLVVAGDARAVAAAAATVLPGTVDQAVFGADLTAVVAGTPSVRVTALLDSCADRESRGAAVVWRVTPGSVRRALDEGVTGDRLQQELAEVAGRDLPQPLRYLVDDVARRHGSLRVRPMVSCVRGDDAALLAQAAADRALKGVGLAVVAPTVLSSQKGADETVAALRAAGYLPMPERADGTVVLPRRGAGPAAGPRLRRRPVVEAAATAEVDLPALALRLVSAGAVGTAAPTSGTEQTISASAPRLLPAQARLLAHAIDHDETW